MRDWVRPAAFLSPALFCICLFLLWPLLQLLGLSFTYWDGYSRIRFDGLETWTSLIGDSTFEAALHNTLIWAAASATIPVGIGFVLSVAFNRTARRLGTLGRAVALIPLLLPPTVVAATWSIIYNPLYGPLDGTLQAVGVSPLSVPSWLGDPTIALWSVFAIVAWSTVGFSVLIFSASIRTIDRTYWDLARAEGAHFRQELRWILIPACLRSAALAIVVTVAIGLQIEDLLLTLHLNGGPGTSTLLLPLDMYTRAFSGTGNVGQAAAEAVVSVGIVFLATLLVVPLVLRGESLVGESDFGVGRPHMLAGMFALVGIVALLLPLWWDALAAFTTGRSVALQPLAVALSHPTLSPFSAAWNSGIGIGMWESLVLALMVVVLALALGFPAAFGLALLDRHPRARFVVLIILVFTLLQPGDTFIIPVYYLLADLHLLDTVQGLVIAEFSRELPFVVLLLWLAMQSLSRDVLAAAELDAGKGLRYLLRILVPLSWPAAAAASLWVFVSSWSEYALPYQVMSMSDLQTAPMALASFIGTSDTEFNLLAAGTLLLVLPVAAALILVYGPAARGLRAAGRTLTR